ncbi:MAG: spore coat protein CotJB [Firmicutes bacterium]|nr:spore coat protein CotJB [Bacillota bacterium]
MFPEIATIVAECNDLTQLPQPAYLALEYPVQLRGVWQQSQGFRIFPPFFLLRSLSVDAATKRSQEGMRGMAHTEWDRMGRKELYHRLQLHQFQAYDWMLYTDMHPHSREGLRRFQEHNEEARQLRETFARRYRPIDQWDDQWPVRSEVDVEG